MYTVCIGMLCLFALSMIVCDRKLFFTQHFLFWLGISCFVGWTEFIMFLRYDAWVFSPQHVTGIRFLGVTIEDYLFCPAFSVVFYFMYHRIKMYQQRVYNPTDKFLFAFFCVAVMIFYYDLGSEFGKYMTFRMGLGFIGLIYCWNNVSFRNATVFMIIVFFIAFGWDIWAVSHKHWGYVNKGVFDGIFVRVLTAKLPLEIFGYYLSGAFFSFWTIALIEKYYCCRRRF